MSPFHSTACLWSFAYFGHAFHVSICLSSSSQPFSLSDLELCFKPNLWDFLIIGSHEADVRGWNVSSWAATWFFSTFVCLDSRVRRRVTCTNRGEEDGGGGEFWSTFLWTRTRCQTNSHLIFPLPSFEIMIQKKINCANTSRVSDDLVFKQL